MKKNVKRALVIAIVAVAIVASAVSGTMALYTKTLNFTGDLTLNPGTGGDPEGLSFCAYGKNSVAEFSGNDIYLKGRSDAYLKMPFYGQGYTLTATLSGGSSASKFGVYLEGQYDTETHVMKGTCLQYESSGLSIRSRSLDLSSDDLQQQGVEGNYVAVAGRDVLAAQGIDMDGVMAGHELAVSVTPTDSGKWEVKIYINGIQVQAANGKPILITPQYQNGPLYVGGRVWASSIQILGLGVAEGNVIPETNSAVMSVGDTDVLRSAEAYSFDAGDVQTGARVLFEAVADFWAKYPYEACGAQPNTLLSLSSFTLNDMPVQCQCGKDSAWRAADGENAPAHDVSVAFAAFIGSRLPDASVTVALTGSGNDAGNDKVESVTYSYGGQAATYTWEDAIGAAQPTETVLPEPTAIEAAEPEPAATETATPEQEPSAQPTGAEGTDAPAPPEAAQETPLPEESGGAADVTPAD